MLANGTIIRYIGIDTPEEGKPGYQEAKDANWRLVEGKKVRLEYDVERKEKTNEWLRKRYGEPRTLAYVYVDGTFVNAYLVENGYARASPYPPNVKYEELFRKLEQKAKEQ